MDLDEPVLFLHERACRECGLTYSLTEGFYLTRKSRGDKPSSYSYECKECTIKRITQRRKKNIDSLDWTYPDW